LATRSLSLLYLSPLLVSEWALVNAVGGMSKRCKLESQHDQKGELSYLHNHMNLPEHA
jgi:hypothetical protein